MAYGRSSAQSQIRAATGAYATATARLDLSCLYDVHRSVPQGWTPYPLRETRDRIRILSLASVLDYFCSRMFVQWIALEDKDGVLLWSKRQACLQPSIMSPSRTKGRQAYCLLYKIHSLNSEFFFYNSIYCMCRCHPAHFMQPCKNWGSENESKFSGYYNCCD